MADILSGFDKFTNFFYSTLDKVSKGVSTYYDGVIRLNEAEAALALSKDNARNAKTLSDLENSTGDSVWATSEDGGSFDIKNSQSILIIAGVALAGFALLRLK